MNTTYQRINIEEWKRKEHFDAYRGALKGGSWIDRKRKIF
ncbi:hypothetical protein SAMN04488522_1021180 [Pedobacter caeni]|uniref:Chloramphenicol acetyltransferase n=1 Tax=Pedobacter caeni TaxID=288992 RepID=A0A1M5BGU4_9SPHI|nr:hypothetical protein SAMN04488522_1021180 [Pedobacter caeni]